MDAPPPEDCSQFTKISRFLLENGFSAPEVKAADLTNGFLLLEDFGDDTYTNCLNNGHDSQFLYGLAVDSLIQLHQRIVEQPEWCKTYNANNLWQEAELYASWYWPNLKRDACPNYDSFKSICNGLFNEALMVPHNLILRDYHIDNLLLLPDRHGINQCGLLDFQDAIWGPVTFDFVSLVEDARCDVDDLLTKNLWQQFLAPYPQDVHAQLYKSGIILSTSRHLKILGLFTRLAYRDSKPHYLKYHPRLKRLLKRCLQEEFMYPLKTWFAENDPEILN